MIDLHCHIDLHKNPGAVVAECVERRMYILSVTNTPSAWEGTASLAVDAPRIRTALGLHPQLAGERRSELALFDKLLPRTRYVGEIGLDGSPEFRGSWDSQLAVFTHVLDACARVGGRVLSIHSRRASAAVLDCLKTQTRAGLPILHWFSGTTRELDRAIELGCWFSVGPAMLCGDKGRALVAAMPRDRVITESDGPFAQIARAPLMPWDVESAVRQLADLWSMNVVEAGNIVHANLRSLIARSLTEI